MSLESMFDYGNLKENLFDILVDNKRLQRIKKEDYIIDRASYATNLLIDFLITYNNDGLKNKQVIEAANKLNGICNNDYGLILSEDLELKAVYNTKFGAYEPKKRKVIFKSPDEVLGEYHEIQSGFTNNYVMPDDCSGQEELLDGKGNLLNVFVDALKEHEVTLKGGKYYLVKAHFISNTGEDFLQTFGRQLDDEINSRAKIVFDCDEANTYGILYNKKPEADFVFNKRFCDYDFNNHDLNWRQPKELLIEQATMILKNPLDELQNKMNQCDLKINNLVEEKIEQRGLPSIERLKEWDRQMARLPGPPKPREPYWAMGGHAIMYASPFKE